MESLVTDQRTIHVLMFPWLAHGHISPYLELAKRLTKRDFIIHLCSTPANLSSIKHKISEKFALSVRLVELHLPSLPNLPPCYHTTNGLPPDLMPTLKLAFDMAKPNFFRILASIKPDLLIYDFLQPWAPSTMTAYMFHFFMKPKVEFPFATICYRDYELVHQAKLLAPNDRVRREAFEGVRRSNRIVLIKGFREIESKYSDYLSTLLGKKIMPVGPLVQNPSQELEGPEIVEWLDKKDKRSTVFVSFGSEYFLKQEEMEELAHGLELSNVNFIWVVRFPKGEKITLKEALPLGFLDRVGQRGMIVEGWAPQARILGHKSIGGFVSHCGCSSMMESMKFGVPIIAMPMHLDQPLNARLVVEIGVGDEVVRNKFGRLEKEEVCIEGGRGAAVRKNARAMSEKMMAKGVEEIDEVVKELVKLCSNNKKKKPNGFFY
ncbi:Beta-D-glucosyl crocetin beta-1,6-glucosyltransferase [Sesamum alatum]|uniref:Glycosyltransferase n=1 Tax=Sesamum alatum TaxID=300844 RepID=A0AAE2CA57_9LAMI|nr:Beta-D-glucosyl crocetin beta-1,6-glucosyltransferase [Sesamum alatum]